MAEQDPKRKPEHNPQRDWISRKTLVAWSETTGVPPLLAGQVQLWWASLAVPDDLRAHLATLLSDHERRRVRRFKFDRHRFEYTVARGGLRVLLGRLLGRDPTTIEFEYGPLGKPGLAAGADGRRLCFNYSDSGGCALYGFAWDCELGVDLERLGREVGWERIAQRRFAGAETTALAAYPAALGGDAFLTCWTRKEAYGKAMGFGIRYPLKSVELCLDCDVDELPFDEWRLRQLYPSADFVGCLVHQRGERNLACLRLDPALLCR